jgi:hypothetical protein
MGRGHVNLHALADSSVRHSIFGNGGGYSESTRVRRHNFVVVDDGVGSHKCLWTYNGAVQHH